MNEWINEQTVTIWSGLENVIEASPAAREQVKEVTSHGGGGVDSSGKKWKVGELEFEALMRLLDNAVSISEFSQCSVYDLSL